jgi:hypothetical protein
MKRGMRYFLMTLTLATCAGLTTAQAQAGREQPTRTTIEKLEASIAFWDDAAAVGLPGVIAASDSGHRWRVWVRRLKCKPSEADVLCSYEAKPCFDAPTDDGNQAWCARQRRFKRGGSFVMDDGWVVAAAR